VAALLLALTATACADHSSVGGPRVLVIGDSLLQQSENLVETALESDGWQAIVDGVSGSRIQDWRDSARLYVEKERPNVAVVELGTNNCSEAPCEDLSAYIDALMHELTKSAEVVFWLNSRAVPAKHPVHPDYVNRQIADAAARYPNIVVVDMFGHFQGHPEWLIPDGLHFNAAGGQQLAELIRNALRDAAPAASTGGPGS
jgi:lysophospholipase L1-like esterase